MTRTLTLLAAAALLALPVARAEARATRAPAKTQVTASLARARNNPALRARQNAMNGFSARMSRLDALMGVPAAASVRARSAEAGR